MWLYRRIVFSYKGMVGTARWNILVIDESAIFIDYVFLCKMCRREICKPCDIDEIWQHKERKNEKKVSVHRHVILAAGSWSHHLGGGFFLANRYYGGIERSRRGTYP